VHKYDPATNRVIRRRDRVYALPNPATSRRGCIHAAANRRGHPITRPNQAPLSTGAAVWECEPSFPPDEGADVPRAGVPTATLAAAPHLEGAGTSTTWNYRASSMRQCGHSSRSPESARAETISLGRSSHRVGGVGRGRLPPRACRRDDGRPSTRRLLGETPVSLEVHRLVALR